MDQDKLYAAILAALGPKHGQAYLEWHESTWPSWARSVARRLEVGHRACPKPEK